MFGAMLDLVPGASAELIRHVSRRRFIAMANKLRRICRKVVSGYGEKGAAALRRSAASALGRRIYGASALAKEHLTYALLGTKLAWPTHSHPKRR